MTIVIEPGFSETERGTIAALYWQAFGQKLGRVLGSAERAYAFFAPILNSDFAISARTSDGALLGLAGFKTAQGAMVNGSLGDLCQGYGWFGGAWRALILSVLERKLEPATLLMDGIFVADNARGQGVGTALLRAIKDHARAQGMERVRLDVIDTNPRARQLYVREGFEAAQTEYLGPLRHIFGFSSSTTMVFHVSQD